jgi:hypothetical protein
MTLWNLVTITLVIQVVCGIIGAIMASNGKKKLSGFVLGFSFGFAGLALIDFFMNK